jgi:hypothetical protein
MAVLHRPVRDGFQECAKNILMSEILEQRVGHNPSLTSWRDLIRILLFFRRFYVVVVVLIVYSKKMRIIEVQIDHNYDTCRHHVPLHLHDETPDDHICRDLP